MAEQSKKKDPWDLGIEEDYETDEHYKDASGKMG